MPSTARILRREWEELIRQAQAAGRGWHFDQHPRTPVVPWYEQQIRYLRANLPNTVPMQMDAAVAAVVVENLAGALPDETFGIEVEMILPAGMDRYDLANKITEAGVQCTAQHYNHATTSYWKVVTDGSLSSNQGCELVSPILRGQAGFDAINTVCQVLADINATVSRQCGLHVHVGARDKDVNFFRNLLKTYAHYEPLLDSITSPSRRGNINPYCHSTKMRMDTVQDLDNADLTRVTRYAGTRYMKLNYESYWRHGTVEFRQHQGTVMASKITAWVKLCLRMVDAANKAQEPDGDTLEAMGEKLGMPVAETEFLAQRARELSRIRTSERR